MPKLIIKENGKAILKTKKNTDLGNCVIVSPENYYVVLKRTLFMSDNLRKAFEELIKAIDDERGE